MSSEQDYIRKEKLEQWAAACSTCTVSYRGQCACGKTFYDSCGHWDWQDGELEALIEDDNSHDLWSGVRFIEFEGKQYVSACDCWHKRALVIIGFVDSHCREIACYLMAERKRKIEKAVADLEYAASLEKIESPSEMQVRKLVDTKLRELDLK